MCKSGQLRLSRCIAKHYPNYSPMATEEGRYKSRYRYLRILSLLRLSLLHPPWKAQLPQDLNNWLSDMLFVGLFAFLPWAAGQACHFHQTFPVFHQDSLAQNWYEQGPTTLTDLRINTPFTVVQTFNETGCLTDSVTATLVETLYVAQTPYEAAPKTIIFNSETASFLLTFEFLSLPLTKFTPGQTITVVKLQSNRITVVLRIVGG